MTIAATRLGATSDSKRLSEDARAAQCSAAVS